MTTDDGNRALALQRSAIHLGDSERRLVTAESCTGGWIGKVLTDIPGSSAWYSRRRVAYSNDLKQIAARRAALDARRARRGQRGDGARDGDRRARDARRSRRSRGDRHRRTRRRAARQAGRHGVVRLGLARRTSEIETRVALETFAGDREAVRRQTVARALDEVLKLDG